jgi:GT2 family glycosyltransferase
MNMNISASLVLYNSNVSQFEAAISGFLAAKYSGSLYVVDNSPVPLKSDLFSHPRVVYQHTGVNVGFGTGHNVAIRSACISSDLHLILNPDIQFGTDVLAALASKFFQDDQLVAAMPKVVYPDGSFQRLCKLLPTPANLFIRRFLPWKGLRNRLDQSYELYDLPQDKISEVPTLSGCFLLIRSSTLNLVGGFDERFFMYMEDVDLVRRLASKGSVKFIPVVSVIHEYAKGSYRNRRLLSYHVRSAIQYFNKWGWFFDGDRVRRNRSCLNSISTPVLIESSNLEGAK